MFKYHLWKFCLFYLDDIIVFARTPQELLDRLRTVLNRLREVSLKVKPSKCALFKRDIEFLGHLVCANGVDPVPDKLRAIQTAYAMFAASSASRVTVDSFVTLHQLLSHLLG